MSTLNRPSAQTSRLSVGAEPDGRIALYLIDESDFPGEIVARVLLIVVVRPVVVRLVPDIVALRGRALHAALGRLAGAEPRRVSALEHTDARLRPQRRCFGRREVRKQPVL